MATLYELTADYAALIDAYDVAESDEERAEILDTLAGLEGDLAAKSEAYARIIKNKQAEADAFKAEAKRLHAKQEAAENAVERLKATLLDAMRVTGRTELPTTIGTWKTQLNPPGVDILDADKVSQEWRVPQPDKIDKQAILRHFKATGEIVEGTDIKRELSLRFR